MKLKHIMALAIGCGSMLLTLPACSDEQQFTDNNTDAKRIEVGLTIWSRTCRPPRTA